MAAGVYSSSPANTIADNYCKAAGSNADIQIANGSTDTRMSGNILAGSGRISKGGNGSLAGPGQWTPLATDLVDQTLVIGDAFVRFGRESGGKMAWGPGNGAQDVKLYRAGVGLLKTDGRVVAASGLGVGNSVLATTPGSVTRKIQVFDGNGISLGYVAVYDEIG
jgi:hypothetical protein